MLEPIEETYFNWLYAKFVQIEGNHTPSNNYYILLRDLHSIEFVWLVSGDDNRMLDGLEIRKEFLNQTRLDYDVSWLDQPCSVLEMFVAFSHRASFETELSSNEWLWIFLTNLGLSELTDATLGVTQLTNEIMDVFLWRTYDHDGYGGMFPLTNTNNDQRKVEIYYQFCEWLIENDIF